jgi:hypothetical protein
MWESGSRRSRRPNAPTINAPTTNVLTRRYVRYCGVAVIGTGAFFGVLR